MIDYHYSQFCKRQASHFLHRYEIPTEYFVSLPLPTKRFGTASYAIFASPARMHPTEPAKVDAPGIWWVLDARNDRILLYARTSIFPFSRQKMEAIILPDTNRTVVEEGKLLKAIENLLDQVSGAFFENTNIDANLCVLLRENLNAYLPQTILPFYIALVPDFFEWLNSA